jgi:hypothetical protein
MISCSNKFCASSETELLLDSINSQIEDGRFILHKIIIKRNKDSILIERFYGENNVLSSTFLKSDDVFFEYRIRGNKTDIELGMDSILTFSIKDTTCIYNSEIEFTPTVFDYTLADCKYKIRKNGNECMTIKQSLIDSTYKEIFFYDKSYNIHKFINLYKNNKCIYTTSKIKK